MNPKATQGDLDAARTVVSNSPPTRYCHAQQAARDEPDGTAPRQPSRDEMAALRLFKEDLGTFVRMHEFLSQMFDYGNTEVEKLYVFASTRVQFANSPSLQDELMNATMDAMAPHQTMSGMP